MKKGLNGETKKNPYRNTDLDAEVARAQDVLNLARHKHGLEFGGQIRGSMRDVEVPERQHQHHGDQRTEGEPRDRGDNANAQEGARGRVNDPPAITTRQCDSGSSPPRAGDPASRCPCRSLPPPAAAPVAAGAPAFHHFGIVSFFVLCFATLLFL